MKVSMTLLTTMMRAAWAMRLPPAAAEPSVVAMGEILGMRVPEGGARRLCTRRGVPFQSRPRHDCPGSPARLADGLGFESTPVGVPTCAPEPAGRLDGSPAPAPRGIRLHWDPVYTRAAVWQPRRWGRLATGPTGFRRRG